MKKLVLIFQTKLNDNNDYQGFDFFSKGQDLLKSELTYIDNLSLTWYDSSELFREQTIDTSIGEITLRLFPNQVARRKQILGFLLEEEDTQKSAPKDAIQPFNIRYFQLLEEAMTYYELPSCEKSEALCLMNILGNHILKNEMTIEKVDYIKSMLSVFKFAKDENAKYLEFLSQALVELIYSSQKEV